MSGGHFDYAYQRVLGFAEELNRDLHSDFSESQSLVHHLSAETLLELESILSEADMFAQKMRAVEWLFSGDTGEESFLKEIKSIGSPGGQPK